MPARPKRIAKLLADMRENPVGVKFLGALAVAAYFFGKPRQSGTSHHVFKTPGVGDPCINLQASGRDAKPHQVRQLLAKVERYELMMGTDNND